jgi:hypothetical protein
MKSCLSQSGKDTGGGCSEMVLRRLFGFKRDETMGRWKKIA